MYINIFVSIYHFVANEFQVQWSIITQCMWIGVPGRHKSLIPFKKVVEEWITINIIHCIGNCMGNWHFILFRWFGWKFFLTAVVQNENWQKVQQQLYLLVKRWSIWIVFGCAQLYPKQFRWKKKCKWLDAVGCRYIFLRPKCISKAEWWKGNHNSKTSFTLKCGVFIINSTFSWHEY